MDDGESGPGTVEIAPVAAASPSAAQLDARRSVG